MRSPYELLHHTTPNHIHLHSFGCLCFPWLKPYIHDKLEPRSTPCIFLGYSNSQYAYLCSKTHKVYVSQHVQYFDSHFPYLYLTTKSPPPPILDAPTPMHHIIQIHRHASPTNLHTITHSVEQIEDTFIAPLIRLNMTSNSLPSDNNKNSQELS